MSLRNLDLKFLFDAYSKNYANIYLEKYQWGEKDTKSLMTHRILNYFTELGIYLGYSIEMERSKIQDVKLSGPFDLVWSINELSHNVYAPVLHIESEHASDFQDIEDELRKLNESPAINKLGIFQFTSTSLNIDTFTKIDGFLKKNVKDKIIRNWLLICDVWGRVKEETIFDDDDEYNFDFYPLIGILYDDDLNIKISKIYCLPFNKMLVKEGQWSEFKNINNFIQYVKTSI